MLQYSAHFDDDNPEGGYVVTFFDFPEAVTQGESLTAATEMAKDALSMAIAYRIHTGEPVPPPSKRRGNNIRPIGLPAIQGVKLAP